jgi:hypothetical protein
MDGVLQGLILWVKFFRLATLDGKFKLKFVFCGINIRSLLSVPQLFCVSDALKFEISVEQSDFKSKIMLGFRHVSKLAKNCAARIPLQGG